MSLPPKWSMAGITFTAGRYCPNVTMGSNLSFQSMNHLHSTGATWIALIVTQWQWSINTTNIFPLFNASQVPPEYYVYVTVTDEDLIAAIRHAHKLGLKIMLKPHVDPLTDNSPIGHTWRGDIGKFFNKSQWDAWFSSYGSMLLHYAAIAEQEKVEMLSLNCELITANLQETHWRSLVPRVRNVFSGLITNSPNGHGHQYLVKWWDLVDVIGVDLYDSINGSTVQEMVQSLQPYLDDIEQLHINYSKPIAFTEIGYCSGGCNRTYRANATDYQRQSRHYEAIFEGTRNRTWFLGSFWWNWDADPAFGPGDSCLTPQFKLAEDVLRKYYRATQPKPVHPSINPQCVGYGTCTA